LLASAELRQVLGSVEAVEDTHCPRRVTARSLDHDSIRPLGLDRDLVTGPEAGSIEALDRKGDLMLGGDPGHAFTLV
jgi:hypothetical protein